MIDVILSDSLVSHFNLTHFFRLADDMNIRVDDKNTNQAEQRRRLNQDGEKN